MARPSRECGSCAVCCEVAAVPELNKPFLTRCRYQQEDEKGSCTIFGQPERPELCSLFYCSWIEGVGSDDDRPDAIGAMFSVNRTERGIVGFAVETRPNAITTTAASMAVDFSRKTNLPIIVSEYQKSTPGEWVIVNSGIREKASAILGEKVATLSEDVEMFVRKIPDGSIQRSVRRDET